MKIYRIDQTLISLEQMPQEGNGTLVLLTSEELDKNPSLAGLEGILRRRPGTPGAAKVSGAGAACAGR